MTLMNRLETLEENINMDNPILIYFSSKNCSVCEVLKPKIEESILKNFPKFKLFEIKSGENRDIASSFSVFSSPSIIIYFDKKEFKRYGRNMSVYEMIEDIKRPYKLMYGKDI
ncbi:MAG: thioredoxin family protein [Arcobacter sp.]|nr:thioredoxin family protein [Arcobacter sp.]